MWVTSSHPGGPSHRARARRVVNRRGIAVLACGHGCVDIAHGAVAALIPFLIHHRGYSYAAASALVLAMTIASSLVQPLSAWP